MGLSERVIASEEIRNDRSVLPYQNAHLAGSYRGLPRLGDATLLRSPVAVGSVGDLP